jgi:hypothetical protein
MNIHTLGDPAAEDPVAVPASAVLAARHPGEDLVPGAWRPRQQPSWILDLPRLIARMGVVLPPSCWVDAAGGVCEPVGTMFGPAAELLPLA